MYSVVMMVAMTSGGESVDCLFRRNRCHGCSTTCSVSVAPVYSHAPVCSGTVVHSAPMDDCCSSSHGCSGRPGLLSRLFHHKNDCCSAPADNCHGAHDCCSGSRGGLFSRFHRRNNDCCSVPVYAHPVHAHPCSGSVYVPAGCTAH
ncbi:MAG: hypothetical protein K2X38_19595 [Gemmataceae bacterium]|nr:hypothetical protein [Gemmataceae bacterium]